MIKLRALPGEPRRPQLAAEEIDAVQRPAPWIEPEYRNTQLIGAINRSGTNAATNKDQSPTSVGHDERRRTLNEFRADVSPPILNPPEVTRTIQIADPVRFASGHDSVYLTEVSHPLGAKLDRFVVRCSPRSWFWCRSHRSRVHPSSDSRRTWSSWITPRSVVGGGS